MAPLSNGRRHAPQARFDPPRLGYIKDPDTGRRRSRVKAAAEVVTVGVPELRIVEDELWQAVRERQARLDRNGTAAPGQFWS